MKTKINTIEDAFALQLQKMLYIEKQGSEPLDTFERYATTDSLRREIRAYAEASINKGLKLERIFNYITQESIGKKTDTIHRMFDDALELMESATSKPLKDILITSALKDINGYKLSGYRTLYIYAVELELDTPSDLLCQIVEWECSMNKALSELVIQEFNKTPESCFRCI